MDVAIEITNRDLYEKRVFYVSLKNMNTLGGGRFMGLVHIYTRPNGIRPFYGLVEANDFEMQYGFVLRSEEKGVAENPLTE